MKKQKPSPGRLIIRDPIARKDKIYEIPDDLPWLVDLGYLRKGNWTRDTIEKYLVNLECYTQHNIVPGAGEVFVDRTDGIEKWEYRVVPKALAGRMEDLRGIITVVRQYLASEEIDAAAARMDGIEGLVRDMRERVNQPLVEHSLASTKKLSQAREQRNSDAKSKAQWDHAKWKREANKIWRRRPTLSKMAVAGHIKNADPSIRAAPETIAKIIVRPK